MNVLFPLASATPPQHCYPEPPLVVDLDGTLIYSDVLWETISQFLRTKFWYVWLLPFWLLLGKAGFKNKMASAVSLDPTILPYDKQLLAELAEQRSRGRCVVLATGTESRFAMRIAQHLNMFDLVLATEGSVNLTSDNKAAALTGLYGAKGFDYIGNARDDLPVWLAARNAYSVTNRPFRLVDGRLTTRVGSRRGSTMHALLKSMRPRQWLKNLLVFVPMLAAHSVDVTTALHSLLAFVAFSLCASSAYLLNDVLDVHDDRLHPTKCERPIAAGTLPLLIALIASLLLGLGTLLLCLFFSMQLLTVVLVYFASTLAYSFYLKRLLMVDIVVLALLYTTRIFGGGVSTQIAPSFWLLAFSFFIFLSLALLKRYSELYNLKRQGKKKTSGRGYTTVDKAPVAMMGVNSGLMSVLVFMLYFNSTDVLQRYSAPHFLLGIVPLLVFWLGRLWTLAFRGQINEDPVLYVSKDSVSLLVIGLCALLVACAAL